MKRKEYSEPSVKVELLFEDFVIMSAEGNNYDNLISDNSNF